jgi:hypothetical protein
MAMLAQTASSYSCWRKMKQARKKFLNVKVD